MKLILSLLMLTFTSCVGFYDQAISASGNKETIAVVSLGGTSTATGANGAHFTHDHQQSFRDGVTALGAYGSAKVTSNATIQTNANNNNALTTQQLNSQNFQLQQQAEADAAAKTAGLQSIAKQAQANGLPIPAKPGS